MLAYLFLLFCKIKYKFYKSSLVFRFAVHLTLPRRLREHLIAAGDGSQSPTRPETWAGKNGAESTSVSSALNHASHEASFPSSFTGNAFITKLQAVVCHLVQFASLDCRSKAIPQMPDGRVVFHSNLSHHSGKRRAQQVHHQVALFTIFCNIMAHIDHYWAIMLQ